MNHFYRGVGVPAVGPPDFPNRPVSLQKMEHQHAFLDVNHPKVLMPLLPAQSYEAATQGVEPGNALQRFASTVSLAQNTRRAVEMFKKKKVQAVENEPPKSRGFGGLPAPRPRIDGSH